MYRCKTAVKKKRKEISRQTSAFTLLPGSLKFRRTKQSFHLCILYSNIYIISGQAQPNKHTRLARLAVSSTTTYQTSSTDLIQQSVERQTLITDYLKGKLFHQHCLTNTNRI